jgi:hypothetical protein
LIKTRVVASEGTEFLVDFAIIQDYCSNKKKINLKLVLATTKDAKTIEQAVAFAKTIKPNQALCFMFTFSLSIQFTTLNTRFELSANVHISLKMFAEYSEQVQ